MKEIHVANTIRSIIRTTGRHNISDYIAPWTMEDQAAYDKQQEEAAANQPPPIDQQVVDVEKAKMLLEAELKREELWVETALKEMEIMAKYKTELVKGRLEMWRAELNEESGENSDD